MRAEVLAGAIAIRLAKEGFNVALVASKSRENLNAVAQEIEALGRQALPIMADVSKSKDVNLMAEQILEKYHKIDVLVNNAGIIRISTLEEMNEEEWDEILDVNLKSVFLCSKVFVPLMIKQKSGKIINISSTGGKSGFPGISHYCASKFGVIGLTQSLAKELGVHNITVNALCPGEVETEMWTKSLSVEWSKGTDLSPDKYYENFVKSYSPSRQGNVRGTGRGGCHILL